MFELAGFRTLENIHNGKNSKVYRCIRESDQTPVIVKQLNQSHPSAAEIARFEREYHFITSLNHPHIIKGHELRRTHSQYALILEDFNGRSANKLIEQEDLCHLNCKLNIFIAVARALSYLHQNNIVHKDINPANIVINLSTGDIKLIDFGISTNLGQEYTNPDDIRTLEGTLAYISPEQTGRTSHYIDARSDLYSLGATFYCLISGHPPFAARDPLEVVHCHIAKRAAVIESLREHCPLLNDILLKLLAKSPEDRYQSAEGLIFDLEHCQSILNADQSSAAEFTLASRDFHHRFEVCQDLIGRDKERQTLMAAFDHCCQGNMTFVAVRGESGIGKTALVRDIHRPILGASGRYISGKFDQLHRNRPYSGLVSALSELVDHVLKSTPDEIKHWSDRINDALGINLPLVTQLIPELEKVVGPQEQPSEMGLSDQENRFHLALKRFISCFTEKPLVMFIDDLQWADQSTLRLLEQLLNQESATPLLVIGSFRSEYANQNQALAGFLQDQHQCGNIFADMTVTSLSESETRQLVSRTLKASPSACQDMAKLIYTKTSGSPFFIHQLLTKLHDQELIWLNREDGHWQWDLDQIKQLPITDNVVNLMIEKIQKLPRSTTDTLAIAACVGGKFDLATLVTASGRDQAQIAEDLELALQERLITPLDKGYRSMRSSPPVSAMFRFQHDRIQQAAYSLFSQEVRARTSLKLARIKLNSAGSLADQRQLFAITDQYNAALELLTDPEEMTQVARLNFAAATAAKAAIAYSSAYSYAVTSDKLISELGRDNHYQLWLDLQHQLVEICYLKQDYAHAEQTVTNLQRYARDPMDVAKAYTVYPLLYVAQERPQKALSIGVEGLRLLGAHYNTQARLKDVKALLAMFRTRLFWRRDHIQKLIDNPRLNDSKRALIMQIMCTIKAPAYYTDSLQLMLNTAKEAEISIRYGHTAISCSSYMTYSLLLGGVIGDIRGCYDFAQLALNLVDKLKAKEQESEVKFMFASFGLHYKRPMREALPILQDAYRTGLETGDLEFAGHNLSALCYFPFILGHNLNDIVKYMDQNKDALQQTLRQCSGVEMAFCYWQGCLNLMGHTADPKRLVGDVYDETRNLPDLIKQNHRTAIYMTYLIKAIVNFFYRNHSDAKQAIDSAYEYLDGVLCHPNFLNFYFFYPLILLNDTAARKEPERQRKVRRTLRKCIRKYRKWSYFSPANYLHRLHLLRAELQHLHQRGDPITDYINAISLAKEQGFIHEAAIASERFAQYWFSRQADDLADKYVLEACHLYQQWGAEGIVKARRQQHSQLFRNQQLTPQNFNQTPIIDTTVTTHERLDLSTVMKASQALSGRIVLGDLLRELMTITLENAGATNGCLILVRDDHLVVRAEAGLEHDLSAREIETPLESYDAAPVSLVNFVSRKQVPVLLDKPATDSDFHDDPYLARETPQSVLCVPVLNQGMLVAILYLENRLSPAVFTPDRIDMINALSAQGAISIKNAEYVASIREKTILESQLQAAQIVQTALLPSAQTPIEGFAHAIHYRAADATGGDWYHYHYDTTHHRLYLLIGDVTGHGIPSAMVTAAIAGSIKTLFNNLELITSGKSAAECLQILAQAINKTILEIGNKANQGMTMTMVAIDTLTGEAVYGNAGHLPIIHLTGDQSNLLFKRSNLLGFRSDYRLGTRAFRFNPGDTLLMFTDGLTESEGPQGDQLSIRKIRKIVNPTDHVDDMRNKIVGALDEVLGTNQAQDDCMILVIKNITAQPTVKQQAS